MLNINLICIGKLKEDYLRLACNEYSKRLGAFCKINIIELAETKVSDNPSQSHILKTIETEGKQILSKISNSTFVIPMCIEGTLLSSPELAKKMETVALSGISNIAFIIGGSFGLSDEVKNRADYKLSMSKMTFPHQLARVMILEQIYRAFSINNNSKYHK